VNVFREHTGDEPLDLLLKRYATAEGMSRWMVDRIVLQHLGVEGSVICPGRDIVEWGMWSFGFEDLKRDELEREQRAIMERLYGKRAA
jgi:hypothetical protein